MIGFNRYTILILEMDASTALISFRDTNKKFPRKEMFNTFKNYFVGQQLKYLNKNIETLFDSYFVFVSYKVPGNEYDLG